MSTLKPYAYATLSALALLGGVLFLALVVFSGDDGVESGPRLTGTSPGANSGTTEVEDRDPDLATPSPPVATNTEPGKPPAVDDGDDDTEEDEEPPPLPAGGSEVVVGVEDSSGNPLARSVVTLRSGRAADRQETDTGGEAAFRDLATGVYSLVLEAPERPTLSSASPLSLEEGESRRVTLQVGDYDLSISGRVINQDGEPVEGLEVVALRYFFESSDEALVPGNQSDQSAHTDAEGYYDVGGLEDGEYEIKTVVTRRYASVKTVVRAGVDSANLVVAESRELRVSGSVTGDDGKPLSGVRVVTVGQSSRATRTDADGNYELSLQVTGDRRAYTVRFRLDGFKDFHASLKGQEIEGEEEIEVDAELVPVGGTVLVTGVVRTNGGEPVVGETVNMHSQNLKSRYKAVTDDEGHFSWEDVQTASDYRVWVRPEGPYKDYTRKATRVAEEVALEIVLGSLGTGRLTGRMVDAEDAPVPRFSLWVRSSKASSKVLRVTGDDDGLFSLDGIPEGKLIFESRSQPRLNVSGITMKSGSETDVELVVDWGVYNVSGRVLDESGASIAGAQVYLSWTYRRDGVRSGSTRKTVSDDSGAFQFTQLGRGLHKVNATASGYRSSQTSYDIGGEPSNEELELRLEEVSR